VKKLYEVQTKKRYQSAGLQFINNLLVLGVLYKNEVRLESIYLPRIECVLIFNETREGSMFPAENIQRKKSQALSDIFFCSICYYCHYSWLWHIVGTRFIFSFANWSLILARAVTHVLLLGGVWLFLDVLFMIWFILATKKAERRKSCYYLSHGFLH
jgi:hypothetical protein